MSKISLSNTPLVALVIFCFFMALSLFVSEVIAKVLMVGTIMAGGFGVACLCFSKTGLSRIAFHPSTTLYSSASFRQVRSLILLALVQIAFLFLSWIFFYMLESQTRLTGRLQALEPGTLILLLKDHPWELGLSSWIMYAICGVGLSYLSLSQERAPTLPTVLFKDTTKQPAAFFYYYSEMAVSITLQMPFVFLLLFTSIWCVESLNVSFNWPSLFLYPLRTTLCFMLIVFIFRKTHGKFLDWAVAQKQPLAHIVCFYVLGIAILLFWMHSFGSYFTFGTEATDPNQVLKSPLAGSFSKQTLDTRLQLLIWGWWGLWLPSMAAIVARLSLGLKVYQACLNALLLPGLVFLGVLSKAESEFLTALFPRSLSMSAHWLIVTFLFLAIMLLYGKVYTTVDIQRGAMPAWPIHLRAWLFRKWVSSALLIFVGMMLASIMLGWLPWQVFGMCGSIFMLSVFLIFLYALFSSKGHPAGEVRCKVPSES